MKYLPSLLIMAAFVWYMLASNAYVPGIITLYRRFHESKLTAIETIESAIENVRPVETADAIPDGEWDGPEILGVSREDVVRVAVRPSLLAGAKPEERKEWLADRIARNVFSTKTELVGACAQEFGVTDRTVWNDLKEMDGK